MSQNTILLRQATAVAHGTTISHEGGEVYHVDPITHLRRFLILGSTGTFYASGYDVTKAADATVRQMITERPRDVLDQVLEVSLGNLALRKDPTIYSLALLTQSTDLAVKREAVEAVATVCRTGTDLLHWLAYRYASRKSNRTFRRALQGWFAGRTPADLALQAVKYDQRDGWTMRDALRLAKPTTDDPDRAVVFDWMAHPDRRDSIGAALPDKTNVDVARLIHGYTAIRREDISAEEAAQTVSFYRLPREAIPGPLLAHSRVWEALLPDMPGRALLRNLGKLGSLGLTDDSGNRAFIVERIKGAAKVCHPFEFLLARAVYDTGRGVKGSLSWTPRSAISTALAEGFGLAFDHLDVYPEQTPLIALDVSGSMSYGHINDSVLSCVDAETALALVLAYQFPNARFMAFELRAYPLDVHGQGYDALRAKVARIQGGGTDCSLPLRAAEHDAEVSAVVSITDSETWPSKYGLDRIAEIHKTRPQFRHAVLAMATNEISIADPKDPRQIDLVGLDASVPQTLALFLSGQV